MSGKKEIKLYSTAFLMSLTVHALVLFFIIIFSKVSLNAQKMVVVDLTLMDPVTAEAGVSDEKKRSTANEPQPKHQTTELVDVQPVKEYEIERAKDEKKEAEVKVTQDHEEKRLDEQLPIVKTVSLAQKTKKNFASEDQKERNRASTSLSRASENNGTSLKEKGVPTEHAKKAVGNGSGNTDGQMKGYLRSHLSYIKDIIQKNITYPETARRNGWMGKVKVSFVIANNGRAKDIKVLQSSGFKILDKSAEEAVYLSSPFPHPPAEARIIIPILYTLH